MLSFWPQGYKTFSCTTQLSMKSKLLINIKIARINELLTVGETPPLGMKMLPYMENLPRPGEGGGGKMAILGCF